MPGDPNSIGYTVFVDSRSGSWTLFGSLMEVQLELEQAEKMKWTTLCGVGSVDDLCQDRFCVFIWYTVDKLNLLF